MLVLMLPVLSAPRRLPMRLSWLTTISRKSSLEPEFCVLSEQHKKRLFRTPVFRCLKQPLVYDCPALEITSCLGSTTFCNMQNKHSGRYWSQADRIIPHREMQFPRHIENPGLSKLVCDQRIQLLMELKNHEDSPLRNILINSRWCIIEYLRITPDPGVVPFLYASSRARIPAVLKFPSFWFHSTSLAAASANLSAESVGSVFESETKCLIIRSWLSLK